jgi:hypothetical protein
MQPRALGQAGTGGVPQNPISRKPIMAKTNSETSYQAKQTLTGTATPTKHPASEGFQPSKKPRTSLASPPMKGGAKAPRPTAAAKGAKPSAGHNRARGRKAGRGKAAGREAGHNDTAGREAGHNDTTGPKASGGDDSDGDEEGDDNRYEDDGYEEDDGGYEEDDGGYEEDDGGYEDDDDRHEAGGDEVGGCEADEVDEAGQGAYARARPALDALPADRLRRINVYVPAAVAIAVGVLPRLMTLREPMRALPGGSDALDKLEDYALAALYAHALTLPFGEGDTRLRALVAEAAPLRERLLSSAELLARFGLLDATHVAAIRNGTGYLDTAQDLTALARLYRASWADIGSKTPVTLAEVKRAAQLGPHLVLAFGQRQQGTDGASDPSEAHDRLQRAYTLFFNAYDDCRRAVAFLRWREGDADDFAPTLKQTQRRRSAPVDADADDGGGDEDGPGGDEEPVDEDPTPEVPVSAA